MGVRVRQEVPGVKCVALAGMRSIVEAAAEESTKAGQYAAELLSQRDGLGTIINLTPNCMRSCSVVNCEARADC